MEEKKTLNWWEYITCDTPITVVVNTLNEWCVLNKKDTKTITFRDAISLYNIGVAEMIAEAEEDYQETLHSLRYQY